MTQAQIALTWLLRRSPWIVPIPGTTKPERMRENVGAEAIELNTQDLREIDNVLAQVEVRGERYPPQLAALVGR